MKDSINYEAPEDWGVSSEETWVSFEELKDNGAPVLEGRDVVSFAVATLKNQPAHGNRKQPAQVKKCDPGFKTQGSNCVPTGSAKPATASRRQKMGGSLEAFRRQKEKEAAAQQNPQQQTKPEQKTEEGKKEAQPKASLPQGAERNQDGSTRVGDLEQATSESLDRVRKIAATPSSDARFNFGRKLLAKFKDHFSRASKHQEGLTILSEKIKRPDLKKLIDFAASDNLDEQIPLPNKKSASVRDILTNAGINVEDKDELKSFTDGYAKIMGFVRPDGSWKTGETHELTGSSLGYFQAQHIAERSDLTSEGPEGIQVKAFNNASENKSDLAGIDPRVTDAIFHCLPKKARDTLNKSGSPKKFYDPTKKNQEGTANSIRGAAVLHMWAMQDGVSAYSAAGQQRSPGEFQVEHIVPLKAGGKDHIDNFALILRRENEPRGDLPLDQFIEQSKARAEDIKADLNDPEVKAEFEKRYRAASFNGQLAPVMGGSVGGLMNDSIVSGVNLGLEKGLGKEGAEKLKFSSENWQKYQSEINEFISKNKINPESEISDLSADQISDLFDIMSNNLGVEKEKMVEYMGRSIFNNYDLGVRHVVNKDTGAIEEGRQGTAATPGSLLNLQNLSLVDSNLTGDQLKVAIKTIKDNHQLLKSSRVNLIRNPDDPKAAEAYYGAIEKNLSYLLGSGDNSPFKSRNYDNRFTASDRSSHITDTYNTILGLLTLDKASASKGNDVFSPGRQNNLTDQSKEHLKNITSMLISATVQNTGFTKEQLENIDSLKKTDRNKLATFKNAMDNIGQAILK